MAAGAIALVMPRQGQPVVGACPRRLQARHGGFYLGSIGGPAALLAK